MAANFWRYCYECILILVPLTKGHLSNVATLSWLIGWPYYGGTTVLIVLDNLLECTVVLLLLALSTEAIPLIWPQLYATISVNAVIPPAPQIHL